MTDLERRAVEYVRACGVVGPESCPLTDGEILSFIRSTGGAESMLATTATDILEVACAF